MWTVFLAGETELHFFAKNLKTSHTLMQTASGASVLKNNNPNGINFVAAPPPPESLRSLLDWVLLNLMPQALISASVEEFVTDPAERTWLLPTQCRRAAGRTEIDGGPLLFEEMRFDENIQQELRTRVTSRPGQLEDISTRPLFSIARWVPKSTERLWVTQHLDCPAIDHYSGELLSLARKVGMPVGCVKALGLGQEALASLLAIWN